MNIQLAQKLEEIQSNIDQIRSITIRAPTEAPDFEFKGQIYKMASKNQRYGKVDIGGMSYSDSIYPFGDETRFFMGLEYLHDNCNSQQKCSLMVIFKKEQADPEYQYGFFHEFYITKESNKYKQTLEIGISTYNNQYYDSQTTFDLAKAMTSSKSDSQNNAYWTCHDWDIDTYKGVNCAKFNQRGCGFFNNCYDMLAFSTFGEGHGLAFSNENENYKELEEIILLIKPQ